MDIIDYELRRYDKWKADLEGLDAPGRRAHRAQTVPQQRQHVRHSPESHPGAGAPQVGKLLRNEHQGRDGGLGLRRPDQLDGKHRRQEVERAERAKRFRTLVKKQEHLLRVAFYLLLNIAEDESIERR
jgi:hypothetical protein